MSIPSSSLLPEKTRRKRRKDIFNEDLFSSSSSPSTSNENEIVVFFEPKIRYENLFPKLQTNRCHFETVFMDHLLQTKKRSSDFSVSAPLEIELRLGCWNPVSGSFKVGISKPRMEEILESAFAWSKKHADKTQWKDWMQSRDAFYKLQNGMQVRTETCVSSDFKVSIRHVWKQKMYDSDFFENDSNGGRLSFNREVNISSIYNIPLIVVPDFVRIKQRKSLVWNESPTIQFRCDFTLSWHGKSFLEADAMQAIRNIPGYEVEFEIVSLSLDCVTEDTLCNFKRFVDEILHVQLPLHDWNVVQSKQVHYETSITSSSIVSSTATGSSSSGTRKRVRMD